MKIKTFVMCFCLCMLISSVFGGFGSRNCVTKLSIAEQKALRSASFCGWDCDKSGGGYAVALPTPNPPPPPYTCPTGDYCQDTKVNWGCITWDELDLADCVNDDNQSCEVIRRTNGLVPQPPPDPPTSCIGVNMSLPCGSTVTWCHY